ncbi:MAG: hypothetical protein ABF868_01935 [Sporolactobacillus sp.]
MTKNGIRGFAAGLLLASAVFAFFYYLVFNGEQGATNTSAKPPALTEAAVTKYLTDHHRKAIDIDAYKQWQQQVKPGGAVPSSSSSSSASSASSSAPVSYSLQINAGMTPGDISNALVSANVLPADQKTAFDSYMHQNNLEKYVQLGTFQVNSSMSIQQLAQVITKNHTN